MNDSRQHQPPAPETAALESDDAHHPDDREHGDLPEETSAAPEPDTSAPGDDDGWLPV